MVTASSADRDRPLVHCAVETERFVSQAGWDQPPRLFSLVETARLVAAEPQLATRIGPAEPGAVSAVEQHDLPEADSLEGLLGRIAWPPEVDGVALAVERVVVAPDAERDLPADPEAALQALAAHPSRVDVRLLVAVLRDGRATCLLRQRAHDSDDQVAVGANIAPGLIQALSATLISD